MKVVFIIFLLYCITLSSGYFFPICTSKDDNSCMGYFRLPSFGFPSLNFGGDEHKSALRKIEEPIAQTTGVIFENFNKIVNPVTAFYAENIYPFISPIHHTVVGCVSSLKGQYIRFLRYVPFLKYEEKVKADSRLYLLFIATSLGIYLVLYVYFTKKLCAYYKQSLKEQYLNKVKKFFNTAQDE